MRLARYGACVAALLANAGLFFADREVGLAALSGAVAHLGTMVTLLPPVFVLLGLLDVWVEREKVTRLLGEKSGPAGLLVALVLGSVAAGPVYAAFPIAAVLLRKGGTLANALVFVGAWSATKVPLLLFEMSAMGWRITLGRFIIDVPGLLAVAWLTDKTVTRRERRLIQDRARDPVARLSRRVLAAAPSTRRAGHLSMDPGEGRQPEHEDGPPTSRTTFL
jgi:uncharacterized membrane protein YraQ (UPF0718 family)